MAKTFVVYKGITAYASIQNIGDRISVSQLELDFAVNQIPKATVVLSMGQLADGSKSPIQEKLNSLEQRLAVKIYLVVTTADSGSASPSPTLIFNGYTSACSYSKTYGSCSIVLGVVSVLNDLAYSSAFSGSAKFR